MNIMKLKILTSLLLILPLYLSAQPSAGNEASDVKWYTIQEAEKLMKESPRPLFIDTYTDWCIWCKRMDSITFTNKIIANILNTKFYPVKFNAEGKEPVNFLGQTFTNDGKYGNAHQLAVALLQGQLSYPTVVFFLQDNGKYSVLPVPGFKQPAEMEALLSFIGDGAYRKENFDEFQKSFTGKIR